MTADRPAWLGEDELVWAGSPEAHRAQEVRSHYLNAAFGTIATPSPMSIAFDSPSRGTILTISIGDDGRLVATYDPDDLDEAAQLFVAEINRMFGRDGA